MSSDLALSIGLMSGWLAFVLMVVWPDPKHCACCARKQPKNQRRHK